MRLSSPSCQVQHMTMYIPTTWGLGTKDGFLLQDYWNFNNCWLLPLEVASHLVICVHLLTHFSPNELSQHTTINTTNTCYD